MADASELFIHAPDQDTYDLEEAIKFGKICIWDLTMPNPTDEDCVFCDEPEQKLAISAFDLAVPLASGRAALKGALGMMRPGYMLGVTREHVTSFAQLSSADLVAIDASFSSAEDRLRTNLRHSQYDKYIRLEHGSDNVKDCTLGSGACVTHAHQHLIPGTKKTIARMLKENLDWQQLNDYSELSSLRGEPYLYVGSDDKHYAAIDPQVVSQWGRRLIAEEDGHKEWDWGVFTGAINHVQTLVSLGIVPQGRMTIRPDGQATFFPRLYPRGEGLYK